MSAASPVLDEAFATQTLFITLLQVLFIGLKLGGVITWSWLWVLSPIWLSVVLAIPVIVIGVIVALTTKE